MRFDRGTDERWVNIESRFTTLGYEPAASLSLARACAAAAHEDSIALAERVLRQFRYFPTVGDSPPVRSMSNAIAGGALTCFEAALLAMDLAGATTGKAWLMAMTRKDPETGHLLGHAAYLYQAASGRFGALAFSRHTTQQHRRATYATAEAVALSYAYGYLHMGLIPLCFGIADAAKLTEGLRWRSDAGDLVRLHDHVQSVQDYVIEVESADSSERHNVEPHV